MKSFLKKFMSPSMILWTHHFRGWLAATLNGYPGRSKMPLGSMSKGMQIIGVTGTNGKTTTCHMIAEILERANYRVGLASTINFKIGNREWKNKTKMTTVSPFALQKFLKECLKAGCHFVIIETTSHAIAQYRNFGIDYEIAVMTNVTHDHLDYHGTFENYLMTKVKLFDTGRTINIINADDKSARMLAELPSKRTITYGVENPAAFRNGRRNRPACHASMQGVAGRPEVLGKKILIEANNSLVSLVTPIGQVAYNLQLPGRFNIYNALAATAVAVALGIHLDVARQALEGIDVIPGRMEKVDVGQSFTVLIDYAHTPDALEKIYQTLEQAKRARIIAVLGACGDRDRSKRPIMGALAGHFADIVIITNEDPYTEDPVKIMDEVASGVPRGATKEHPMTFGENFFKIKSRRLAMEKALNLAYKDDIVIITGKGAEECIVVGTEKVPWSDRKVAKEILLKRVQG